MYVSLGFEDLEAIMGWVELRGGGAHVADAKRGGLGFDSAWLLCKSFRCCDVIRMFVDVNA